MAEAALTLGGDRREWKVRVPNAVWGTVGIVLVLQRLRGHNVNMWQLGVSLGCAPDGSDTAAQVCHFLARCYGKQGKLHASKRPTDMQHFFSKTGAMQVYWHLEEGKPLLPKYLLDAIDVCLGQGTGPHGTGT